jgi:hypothetical protein
MDVIHDNFKFLSKLPIEYGLLPYWLLFVSLRYH